MRLIGRSHIRCREISVTVSRGAPPCKDIEISVQFPICAMIVIAEYADLSTLVFSELVVFRHYVVELSLRIYVGFRGDLPNIAFPFFLTHSCFCLRCHQLPLFRLPRFLPFHLVYDYFLPI